MGLFLSLHVLSWMDLSALLVGMSCPGPLSSAFSDTSTESFLSLRSTTHLGSVLSLCSFTDTGSSMSLRSFAHVDFSLLVAGLACVGSVFVPSVLDNGLPDFPISARSFSYLDSSIFALDSTTFDFLLLVQSYVRSGSIMSLLGMARFDYAFSLSIQDFVFLASTFPVRSFGRFDFALSTLGFADFDSPISLRQPCCADSSLFVCGLACLNSSLFAFSESHPGFPLLSKSLSQMELSLFPFDSARMGSLMSIRQFLRVGPSLPVPGSSCTGFVFLLLVIDKVHYGSSLPVHSLGRLEPVLSVFDFLRIGFSMPLQCVTWLGLVLLMMGISRADPVSSLSVTDSNCFDSLLLSRSLAHSESMMFSVDFSTLGPLSSLRSMARTGLTLLMCGGVRPGFLLPALDAHCAGSPLPLHSFSCLELFPSSADLSDMGFVVSPRSFLQVGSIVPPFGLSRAGLVSLLSVIDCTHLESFLLVRSSSRFDFLLSVLDFLHIGSSLPVRSFACLGSTVSTPGRVRPELVFILLVIDDVNFDPLVLLRSLARMDSGLFMLDASASGSSSLLKSSGQPDPPVLAFGCSYLDLPLLSPDVGILDSAMFPKSPGCLGSVPLMSDRGHIDSSMLLQSSVKLGLLPFIAGISRAAFVSSLSVVDVNNLGLPPSTRSHG